MTELDYSLEELLQHYRGRTPRGAEGDEVLRASLHTDVLQLTDESLSRDALTPDETDDLLGYAAWNQWDLLGTRVTEGESGLIPRQEYESLAAVELFQSYPELFELITDAVGVDGLVEIGGTTRREIGSLANALHIWCCCAPFTTGRGILMGLDWIDAQTRAAELSRALQFPRRLFRGLWGDDGGMFASMRGYRVPVLEGSEWLERFRDEAVWFSDPEEHKLYTRFNATTQLLTFMLHFDNRLGLGDSGPYPTGDGGFLIVRDHFLSDTAYHWFDVAEDLPHAITQAMYFKPPEGMSVVVNDLSTTFTQPASYLPYMTGMAVYARDRWDTPVSEIRRVEVDEMRGLTEAAQKATMRLYKRISLMSKRDRIMAGYQTYAIGWTLPFLRLAGVWDKAVEQGFYELDPRTSEAYYKLVGGFAAEKLPQVVIAGEGGVPTQPGAPVRA